MKKLLFRSVALLGCAAVLGLTSCREDGPKPNVDPKKEQQEEIKTNDSNQNPKQGEENKPIELPAETFKPHRIELELFEGHLHGKKDFHYLAGPKEVKYARLDQTINFIWDEATKSYKMDETGIKRFAVQTGILYKNAEAHNPVYGLWVNYYDKTGAKLNDEIGSGSPMSEYQHFFTISNVKPMVLGKAEADDNDMAKVLNYIYRDTNPWDGTIKTGATVIETTNPIGLKGFFTFLKERKTFDLKITLWHGYNGSKLSSGISPFSAPNEEFRKNGRAVFEITVPVIIYRSRDELAIPDAVDTPIDALEEEEKIAVRLFMEAFNVSAQEAIADFYYLYAGKYESEAAGAGRWF